jgi:hypothetical protein
MGASRAQYILMEGVYFQVAPWAPNDVNPGAITMLGCFSLTSSAVRLNPGS